MAAGRASARDVFFLAHILTLLLFIWKKKFCLIDYAFLYHGDLKWKKIFFDEIITFWKKLTQFFWFTVLEKVVKNNLNNLSLL